ncbi:hypothetical protein ACRB8A_14375 [Arthrobacter sp. G.S.26]|uniref:hypothetical protein n=1 Tax=Arthrobacter sp. G.S.26 TaxID=3433706 RepID=UPI003D76F1FA
MAKTQDKNFQYKAVSAGIALGLCMIGRYHVPSAKLPLEFAFQHAWQQWKHKERFPAVGKLFALGVPTVDPYIALVSADERVRTPYVPFYWDDGEQGGYQVYGREGSDWDPDLPEDLQLVAGGLASDPTIPAAAWESLARDLLAELDA